MKHKCEFVCITVDEKHILWYNPIVIRPYSGSAYAHFRITQNASHSNMGRVLL